MAQTLQSRVLYTVERARMIVPGDRVGIGVSGGADSVALLRLFAALRSRLGVGLLVLHFHHQLRGAEADEDEAFVASLAQQLGLEFVADRADVAAEARRNGWNLEDAARRLRYRFFDSVAAARGLNCVAVAHTADDQAETVLAHVLRGTGPAGLAGIYPVAGVVIRPLLDIRRDELRAYLNGLQQPWREDVTNQDTSRTRARIRHKVLPLLETDFEPVVVERLGRLASLAREEEVFWRAFEQERFAALVSLDATGRVSISVVDLLSPFPSLAPNHLSEGAQLALTRRLIRRIYFELRGSRQQLTARHVEDVVHLAAKGHSGSRLELPEVIVERVFGRLVFSRASAASRTGKSRPGLEFEYSIARPESSALVSISIPEISRRFHLKIVDWSARARETITEQSTLDCDRLRWPLVLRNWRAGDSYRPYRRHRARKLKRMLLESRIPVSDRASWPVLTSAGALVWALRFPVADEFAPQAETLAGLIIAEEEF
jgi:tRNA(Ile)-lysidine synthase